MYTSIIILCLLIVWSSAAPNIIFFLTDDQDVFLGGMKPMVKTKKLIAEEGITFVNAMANTPLCCPSRSSILTGRYVHNHGTWNNSVSGGCSSSRWRSGPENQSFAAYLKQANYTTFYAGKYLNQYGFNRGGGVKHVPKGWDRWNGLVGNSRYYNYELSVNGKRERHKDDPDTDYLTSVIRSKALSYLRTWDKTEPLFMMLATPAPHGPFTPLPQYAHNFSSYHAPRTPNFNVRVRKDKHWMLRQLPSPLPHKDVVKVDEMFRNRWRTLLSVDDLVADVMEALRKRNVMNNTYVFYSSDHGYHLGQFSLPMDKRQPYEFDIRVPLLMMGPNVPKNKTVDSLVSLIDLAPTFLSLAGVNVPKQMDGRSLWPIHKDNTRTQLLVTHRGEGTINVDPNCPHHSGGGLDLCDPTFSCKCQDSFNNTYSCVRELGGGTNFLYCEFSDTEGLVEAYDVKQDPYQMHSVAHDMNHKEKERYQQILSKLKSCGGANCFL